MKRCKETDEHFNIVISKTMNKVATYYKGVICGEKVVHTKGKWRVSMLMALRE